jgi:4-coumarate--CoA ligase
VRFAIVCCSLLGLPLVLTGSCRDHEELPRAYVTLKAEHKGASSEWDIEKWIAGRVAKHKQLSGGVVFIDEV